MKTESENKKFAMYVEYRLQAWVRWLSGSNGFGLGFPPCSLEYRLMTEAVVERRPGPKPLHCNEEAEEIEFLVREMSKQNNKMALALRIHYFGKRKSKDYSSEIGIAATQFRVFVDMGRQWLAGRLSAPRRLIR